MSITAEALSGLREESRVAGERMREILSSAKDEQSRSLTEEETGEFDRLASDAEKLDARIEVLVKQVEREEKDADRVRALEASTRTYGSTARVTSEAGPYTPTSAANHGSSYFRDLYRANKGDQGAHDRLRRNNDHVAAYSERTALSTVNGVGGEFVPPLWLENQFVQLARPGRVTADIVTKDALPSGTDSINIPKISAGTGVGLQGFPTGGQNTGITEVDLTTTSISSGVVTVAGGQTISMQLLEQSPLNIDKVVLADLARAYAIQVDDFVLNGSGSAGQPLGLLNVAGVNAVTFTSASPALVSATVANSLYAQLTMAISKIASARFDQPSHIVMHPRRWNWALGQVDSSTRPVLLENQYGLFNGVGKQDNEGVQGVVGSILGLPVVVDSRVPTNLGAGTNQDPVVVAKFDDLWLWEGNVRAEAFEQTFANNLSLFVRLYNYMSFQGARFPASISVINGTGLVAPAGY